MVILSTIQTCIIFTTFSSVLYLDTFKYGISDDLIDEDDGLSARVRDQVEEWNLTAEYNKFDAEILEKGILGRDAALQVERAYIDAYYTQQGRNPRGNKFPKRK